MWCRWGGGCGLGTVLFYEVSPGEYRVVHSSYPSTLPLYTLVPRQDSKSLINKSRIIYGPWRDPSSLYRYLYCLFKEHKCLECKGIPFYLLFLYYIKGYHYSRDFVTHFTTVHLYPSILILGPILLWTCSSLTLFSRPVRLLVGYVSETPSLFQPGGTLVIQYTDFTLLVIPVSVIVPDYWPQIQIRFTVTFWNLLFRTLLY